MYKWNFKCATQKNNLEASRELVFSNKQKMSTSVINVRRVQLKGEIPWRGLHKMLFLWWFSIDSFESQNYLTELSKYFNFTRIPSKMSGPNLLNIRLSAHT